MSETKEELEKRKLLLEINDLKKPFFLKPGFLLSAATALTAIIGLGINLFLANDEIHRTKAALEAQKLDSAKVAFEADKKTSEANKQIAEAAVQKEEARVAVEKSTRIVTDANENAVVLRWETVALKRERLAQFALIDAARSGMAEVVRALEDLSTKGFTAEKLEEMQRAAIKKSSIIGASRCTKHQAAVYDEALVLDPKELPPVEDYHAPWGNPASMAGHDGPSHIVFQSGQTEPTPAITSRIEPLYQAWWLTGYDRHLRLPQWVTYRLGGNEKLKTRRRDCWRPDPRIPDETSTEKAFRRNPYDRGHLVPRRDMSTELAASSTYLYSNITPQLDWFNRGIWLGLEKLVESWSRVYDPIYVTSGVVFDHDGDGIVDASKDIPRLGDVAIPSHFYKILVRRHDDHPADAIAFLLANNDEFKDRSQFSSVLLSSIVTIRQLEILTGFDFFPNLTEQQSRFEDAKPSTLWRAQEGDPPG